MPARRKEDAAFCCTPLGYLGAAAPKRRFGHFFAAEKVTRPRKGETLPPLRQGLPTPVRVALSEAESAGPGAGS